MTWIIGWLVVVVGVLDSASAAGTDDKLVPINVHLSEGGLGFRPPQQPQYQYQQPYPNQFAGNSPYEPSAGYSEDHQGPPNYGNSIGPGENSIEPAVNPFPKLTHCRTTGKT